MSVTVVKSEIVTYTPSGIAASLIHEWYSFHFTHDGIVSVWAQRSGYRTPQNLDSCFQCNVNQQYNRDWLVLVLYLFVSCNHTLPPHPQLWCSSPPPPPFRLWRALIRILLFWRTRCHTPVQLTHHARSMALCLAISTPLCEGNDCRCVRKPLVGTRRSRQETNKHYGSFRFSFWIAAVLHLLELLESHLQLFPLSDWPHYIQTPISTASFLNEDICNCTLITNMIHMPHDVPELSHLCTEQRWDHHDHDKAPVLLCHDASIAPSVCLLQGPKTICCKLYYGLFRLICCLQTRCDWVSIHSAQR